MVLPKTLSHTAAISRASHPVGPVPGGKQRKTLGWWWSYQEPIPKRSLTLLPSPEPFILLPGPVPGRKQRNILGWWWPYQEPIPLPITSTLPHRCNLQSLSSCCQVQYLGENKAKHCVCGGPAKNLFPVSDLHKGKIEYPHINTTITGLVVALPKTYSQTLFHTAAISRASHPAARSNTLEKTKANTVLEVALPGTYSLSVTNIGGKLKTPI